MGRRVEHPAQPVPPRGSATQWRSSSHSGSRRHTGFPSWPRTTSATGSTADSYLVTLHVNAPVDEEYGWVTDFADIAEAFRPTLERLDHHYLNEIDGLENPTTEILARWIWREVAPRLPHMSQVSIAETCTSGCVYRGE